MIELTQTTVRRGGRVVLQEARVQLPAAGTVGIVGVNGAGKSTLFCALTGLLSPAAGRVRLGQYTAGNPAGYSPQQPSFPGWLTVEQVARLFRLDYRQLEEAWPGLLLKELEGRMAGALSVGQRQVLSVAIALGLGAPLTLLDEPFAPLDFRRRIGLVRALRARQERGSRGLILISSQAAVDLLDTCDWVVVLRDGRYVHSGAAAELAGSSADPAGARERFEDAIMTLLGAPAPTTCWP